MKMQYVCASSPLKRKYHGEHGFLSCLVILLPEEVALKACLPWASILLCIVCIPALAEAKKKYLKTWLVNLCGRLDMHGFFAIYFGEFLFSGTFRLPPVWGVSRYYIFVLSLRPFVSNNVSQLQGLPTWRGRKSEGKKKIVSK